MSRIQDPTLPFPTIGKGLPPSGCHKLGKPIQHTAKAIQFRYHGWIIWLPAKAVYRVNLKSGDKEYWGMAWAVKSSKEHPSARTDRHW